MRGIFWATWIALGALAAAPALAADLPTKKPAPAPVPLPVVPSTWRFELTGYGWASSVVGNAGVRGFPTLPFYLPFGKLLEHLEGAFMGNVVARNGTFIGGVDLMWSRLGASGTFKNPNTALYGTQADVTLSEGFLTSFGGVRIPVGPPNLELYGTVGARVASVGYNWTPSISTTLGYRVLYSYEKQDTGAGDQSFRLQQWLYGPFAGFKYSF
jgi:hypothetical protein